MFYFMIFFLVGGGWGFLHHPRLSPFHLDFHIKKKKKEAFLRSSPTFFQVLPASNLCDLFHFSPARTFCFSPWEGGKKRRLDLLGNASRSLPTCTPHQLAFKSLCACALVKTFGGKKVKTRVAKPGVGLKQRRLASAISVDATTTSSMVRNVPLEEEQSRRNSLLLNDCASLKQPGAKRVLKYLRLVLVSLFKDLGLWGFFLGPVSALDWTVLGFLIKTSSDSANITMTQ